MKLPATILGPVPPPRGGVSVHVQRLAALLREEGHPVRVLAWSGHLDPRPWRRALATAGQWLRLAAALPAARGGVLHLHYAHLPGLLALAPWLLGLPARRVLTLHSIRLLEDLDRAGPARRYLARRCLARFALVVAVRQEIADAFAALGVAGPQVLVMPAFLPPAPSEWAAAHLAPHLAARLGSGRDPDEVQLACAAYVLGPGYGHEDIYGVELATAALAAILPAVGRRVRLWVMVSNPLDGPARAAAARLAALAGGCPELALEIHVDEPLVPLLARVDGLLRPSREDGDSVAIREALALGRPVWASDVVRRPPGCRTFPLDDPDTARDSLAQFVDGLAAAPPPPPAAVAARPDDDRFRVFASRLTGSDADASERTAR